MRGTVQTGPAPSVLPWQVEWVVGHSFRCYIGRVFDEGSIGVDDEFVQKRFAANQQQRISLSPHKMSSNVLNRNVTSMDRHVHSEPVKTGSTKIYTKATRGRITTPSTSVDENLGYATWAESAVRSSTDTYFVLHKIRLETDSLDEFYYQWCLSVVGANEVIDSDIKIACFKYARGGSASRANLIQLWKSDIMPSTPTVGGGGTGGDTSQPHPFQIVKNEGFDTFYVREGTVNNSPASYPDTGLNNVTVWLQTYPSVAIVVTNESMSTNESQAWLRIGRISHVPNGTGYTTNIYQYIRNSLWLERFKCGSDPAQYWYSQI